MDIFSQDNYRKIIKDKLHSLPKAGHGQAKKMAQFINVSTAFISQVLAEIRHLTAEQAYLVAEFLVFSDLETKYFLKLHEVEKSGNYKHQLWLQKEIEKIREESKKISNRINYSKVLSDEEKAVFYSDWYYSAIRMFCSIENRSVEELVSFTGLPKKIISEAIQFLLKSGLLIEVDDKYKIGLQSTHLNSDSPWVALHHSNWRKKALENVKVPSDIKVHYTSPMTLSKKDAQKVQALIHETIEKVGKIVDPSPSEEVMCLNIDWFPVGKIES